MRDGQVAPRQLRGTVPGDSNSRTGARTSGPTDPSGELEGEQSAHAVPEQGEGYVIGVPLQALEGRVDQLGHLGVRPLLQPRPSAPAATRRTPPIEPGILHFQDI